MEPKKLLELAIEACGSEIQLAQRLGISEVSAATSSFGRWRRGDNKPDYDTTMKLLEAAGLLRQPEDLEELRQLRAQAEEVRTLLDERRRREADR